MKILAALVFFYGHYALAIGGWGSGGGELIKDAHNPWFLNNIEEVRYCIQLDEKNFGAARAQVSTLVVDAFNFWKKDFSKALLPTLQIYGPIKIASQNFREVSCDTEHAITLQFGVLSDEQRAYLQNPSSYAAVSVRTDYDAKNLSGRGFVYVSPAMGPLRYAPENVVENAWGIANGHLLYLTLLHEFGHIFGLQHSGSYGSLMSEGFVESLLIVDPKGIVYPRTTVEHFFSLPTATQTICPPATLLSNFHQVFGGSPRDLCYRFEFSYGEDELFSPTQVRVLSSISSASKVMHEVAKITVNLSTYFPETIGLIWLTNEQNLFSKSEITMVTSNYVIGAPFLSIQKQGQLRLPNRNHSSGILVRWCQGQQLIAIDGLIGSKLIPLVD